MPIAGLSRVPRAGGAPDVPALVSRRASGGHRRMAHAPQWRLTDSVKVAVIEGWPPVSV